MYKFIFLHLTPNWLYGRHPLLSRLYLYLAAKAYWQDYTPAELAVEVDEAERPF